MSSAVKVSEFDVDQFNFEPFPEKYKRNCIQSIMLPSYKGERCPIIQLPWIEISQYGVPTKNEFFKEDTQRYFIKLPLADAKSEELREWLETIDKKFGNSAVKEKLLGDKSKHTYQPLLRTRGFSKIALREIQVTEFVPSQRNHYWGCRARGVWGDSGCGCELN